MQGIYLINDEGDVVRPRSKKQVREVLASDSERVIVEATSIFGNEFDGPASKLDVKHGAIYFVGPDPSRSRRFYGSIRRLRDGRLQVK